MNFAFFYSLLAGLFFGLWQNSPLAGIFCIFALQVPIHCTFAILNRKQP